MPVVKILNYAQNIRLKVYICQHYIRIQQPRILLYSKLSALYIREFCKINKLKYVILRYGSLYNQDLTLNGIYNLLEKIIKNKKINFIGRSDSKREYIHVKDAARASVDLIQNKFDNQSIIVTGEISYKLSDLIQIVSEIIGKKLKQIFLTN